MINNFSFDSILWGQINSNRISFRIGNLDRKIHFTFSFHKDSPKVNLHITKNISNENKPTIYIVEIDKKVFEETLPGLMTALFESYIEPVDLVELERQYKDEIKFYLFK